jgi:hypothetical protein
VGGNVRTSSYNRVWAENAKDEKRIRNENPFRELSALQYIITIINNITLTFMPTNALF